MYIWFSPPTLFLDPIVIKSDGMYALTFSHHSHSTPWRGSHLSCKKQHLSIQSWFIASTQNLESLSLVFQISPNQSLSLLHFKLLKQQNFHGFLLPQLGFQGWQNGVLIVWLINPPPKKNGLLVFFLVRKTTEIDV